MLAPTPRSSTRGGASCPRLPVWEEANQRGFIEHQHETGTRKVRICFSLGNRAPEDLSTAALKPSRRIARTVLRGRSLRVLRPQPRKDSRSKIPDSIRDVEQILRIVGQRIGGPGGDDEKSGVYLKTSYFVRMATWK